MATLVEQILGGKVGETILCDVDKIITDDWTTTQLIGPLNELEGIGRFMSEKVTLIYDHAFLPEKYKEKDRERIFKNLKICADFENKNKIKVIKGKGIQHHVVLEEGLVSPGNVIVGNDSHTCTVGAFCAYGKAMQPLGVATVIKTGQIPITIPETVGVELTGKLSKNVSPRDLALYMLKIFSEGGESPRKVTGKVIEYFGEGLENMDLFSSTVLANMSSEAVATTCIFPVTKKLKNFLNKIGLNDYKELISCPSDYTDKIIIDLQDVVPLISRNGNPADVVPVEGLEGKKIDQVFIGTCAGGKYSDIKEVWSVLKGKKVKVRTILFPTSEKIMALCDEEGISEDLREAGVEIQYSGCGPCFGFGIGRMKKNQVTVSTGNRNYLGRMGDKSTEVLLVSGYTAGMCALHGEVRSPKKVKIKPVILEESQRAVEKKIVSPTIGNVWLFPDDISTDDITPSIVPDVGTTSQTKISVLKQLAFRYVNPDFKKKVRVGDFVVAGHNFGKGSNRASSVEALKAWGIKAVIAKSIAPIYLEGALFSGLSTIILDDECFYESLNEKTILKVDFQEGKITNNIGEIYSFKPWTKLALEIFKCGGIINLLKKHNGWPKFKK